MQKLVVGLAVLLTALGASAQTAPVVVSDAESTANWRGDVTLIDDAAVGQHAVRYSVPIGRPAGPSLTHAHVDVPWGPGLELRFRYRFSGAGSSNLMIKLVAHPFADGMQATWQVAPDLPADGQWHTAVVNLGTQYMRWGDQPDTTGRYIQFRTDGKGEAITLDLDQVVVVPVLFDAMPTGQRVEGDRAMLDLALSNRSGEPLALRVSGVAAPVTVPAGETARVTATVTIDRAWMAAAAPLDTMSVPVTVAVEGLADTEKELSVSVVKPVALPAHPRVMISDAELPALREKIAAHDWAKAAYDREQRHADSWLKRAVELPPRGAQWWHWYACEDDGGRLKTLSPTEHQCTVCNKIYSGWPYDDVVLDRDHHSLASGLKSLGLIYRMTGDERYLARAREILLAYADRYQTYELHDIHGKPTIGGGRVGPQTLDESTWLIRMVQGADLIWDALSDEDRERAEDGLFRPAAEVIRQHKIGIHNIQCWKNSAVGLVGILLGDPALIADAVSSPHGFRRQIAEGVNADGQWYEGAWGYHFYTVSAIQPLAEAGERCGLGLYDYAADGRSYRLLFEGPLAMAMPDLRLPAFNDSGVANVKGNRSYEGALAHYGDAALARPLQGADRASLEALVWGVGELPDSAAAGGASRNLPGAGYSILQHGDGPGATWACLKYGEHGGGHGHPDKLNLALYKGGHIVGVDPGTAAYGVPIQREWYRTTIAHNTLTVDEADQKPATGRSLAFLTRDGVSAALAEAGAIYEGVSYRRAVALLGEELVIVLDLVTADAERTFDLAWHNAGEWATPPQGEAIELPDKHGYKHLKQPVRLSAQAPLVKVADDLQVALATAAVQPVETWAAIGIGTSATEKVPALIQRVRGREATVAWALGLDGERPQVTVSGARGSATAEVRHGGRTYRVSVVGDALVVE